MIFPKLIVGLGNPGLDYEKNRHNVGKRVVDRFSKFYKRKYKLSVYPNSEVLKYNDFSILKPLVYMNLSGISVKEICVKMNVSDSREIFVVYDDIDLEFGRLKIKRNGGSGGHKGIESIIDQIKTNDFYKLKIGIGRDFNVVSHVLSDFTETEETEFQSVILEKTNDLLKFSLQNGYGRTMNFFNKKE